MTKTKKRAGLAAVCIAAVLLVLGTAVYFWYGNNRLVDAFSEPSLNTHLSSNQGESITVLDNSGICMGSYCGVLFTEPNTGSDLYLAVLKKHPLYSDRYTVETIAGGSYDTLNTVPIYSKGANFVFCFGVNRSESEKVYSLQITDGTKTSTTCEIITHNGPFVQIQDLTRNFPLVF